MPIRSMTGFAQVKGQVVDPPGNVPGKSPMGFTLSLKAVNHRFLDVHFRYAVGQRFAGNEIAPPAQRENWPAAMWN